MDSDRLTLTALASGVLGRWRDVAGAAVGIAALALVLSFILPPGYESQATFVTAESEAQMPRGLADVANQPGMAGLVSQLGLGTSSDPSTSPGFYAELLNSRELLTELALSRFADPRTDVPGDSADLLTIYRITSRDRERAIESAVKLLKREMTLGVEPRTSFVSVTMKTPWASLSAAEANRAVDLVSAFNRAQRRSRAGARRGFLEGRVADAHTELRTMEGALASFYERNRLWRSSPSLVVEEAGLQRQVDMASQIYLTIRQQYESARLDEINTTPVITVVDSAVASHKPMWPRRAAITLAAGLLGAWLGLLWAAAWALSAHWATHNPADATALRESLRRTVRELTGAVRRRG